MQIKEFCTSHRKKIFGIGICLLIALFSGLIYWFIARPMIHFVEEPELFREWVEKRGLFSHLVFVFMLVFQIVIAFIPGEPFELAAGYAFGPVMGTLLCIIGSLIGGALVFLLTRRFGMPFVELFFNKEKIARLKFLKHSRKRDGLLFLLFLIPGTPKDILCYIAGLTDIKFPIWLIICTVAKIPSIITSTVSGGALNSKQYFHAALFLIITLIISIAGVATYRFLVKKFNKK